MILASRPDLHVCGRVIEQPYLCRSYKILQECLLFYRHAEFELGRLFLQDLFLPTTTLMTHCSQAANKASTVGAHT